MTSAADVTVLRTACVQRWIDNRLPLNVMCYKLLIFYNHMLLRSRCNMLLLRLFFNSNKITLLSTTSFTNNDYFPLNCETFETQHQEKTNLTLH